MGAYEHSPLREGLFGGVTQDISLGAEIPVLMSHWRFLELQYVVALPSHASGPPGWLRNPDILLRLPVYRVDRFIPSHEKRC